MGCSHAPSQDYRWGIFHKFPHIGPSFAFDSPYQQNFGSPQTRLNFFQTSRPIN